MEKLFESFPNLYSSRALLKNGFVKKAARTKGENWGGRDEVELEEYVYSAE